MKYDLLIRRARQVVSFDNAQMNVVEQGSVACFEGSIVWVGRDADRPADLRPALNAIDLDANGLVVLPGLIDSHTHTVFAGSREDEFEEKIGGVTYAEIAARGGGIRRTMEATRKAGSDELVELGRRRVREAARLGITTLEIKSGYGLSVREEVRILKVIRELQKSTDVRIVPTFLGAHTVPPEWIDRRDEYVQCVCDEMIPQVAAEKLAVFCDVFCETNIFTPQQTRRIFEASLRHGLKLKMHADQLTNTGGAELCAEMGAVSADHLETISDQGIEALARSSTVACLLPGCSFFLNMRYAPARKLIEAGVRVALATDFNPGSSMTQNLPLIMSIACTQLRMSVEETIRGVTLFAAQAVDRSDLGNIRPGLRADLALFDVPSYKYIPYNYGHNHVVRVIKDGRVIV